MHVREGDWVPPYGPFAEALAAHIREANPEELRQDLGPGAAPLARLVPVLREKLPDIPEPVALQPDEERFRLARATCSVISPRRGHRVRPRLRRHQHLLPCLQAPDWSVTAAVRGSELTVDS